MMLLLKAQLLNQNETNTGYNMRAKEFVNKAEKEMGLKGTSIVSSGSSEELDSVNAHSPIATRKINKYGV